MRGETIRTLIPAWRRTLFIAGCDALLVVLTYYLSFVIRFDAEIPAQELKLMLRSMPILFVIQLSFFYGLGVYRGIWRYASIEDLMTIFKAASMSIAVVIAVVYFLFGLAGFPRSVFIIDWLLLIVFVGGSRFLVRAFRAGLRRRGDGKRVLIYGAGDTGEALLRDLITRPALFQVVGIIDDNPDMRGRYLHGVPILGPRHRMYELARRYQVEEIYIAIPSANAKLLKELIDSFKETGTIFRRVPAMRELVDGHVTLQHLRQIELEDLLSRAPVLLDHAKIGDFLNGRCVLVTGAGGSIGSALCRHILGFRPDHLILLDQAESGLYNLGIELQMAGEPARRELVVADVTDADRIDAIFAAYKPQIVFHAAAHKHVPLMEYNRSEAIKNNVVGTRVLAEAALHHGVEKFVMISTDKAVNPTSIMGASKRIAEMMLQVLATKGGTHFITVRFGNVLGSDGSVVPLFKRQILAGGPVTVTHPAVERYFMTINEAVQLVLQAGAMGTGGKIYVLDMGEPVRILELARNLILLSGHRLDDIEIKFVGLRPGEKLTEELWINEENIKHTSHHNIMVADSVAIAANFPCNVERLIEILPGGSDEELLQMVRKLIPTYKPDATAPAANGHTAVPAAPPRLAGLPRSSVPAGRETTS